MRTVTLALALALAPLTAGCLGLFGGDAGEGDIGNQGLGLIGNQTLEDISGRASLVPRNYTFPLQSLLPAAITFINGTVGPDANLAYEDRNDRGGNELNTILQKTDVSQFIPNGQPTEMRLTLYAAPQPGSAADLDLYVDVPGTTTKFAGDNGDEFNNKWLVQRMVVNTIGVSGEAHEIGVQIANGKLAEPLAYTIRAEFFYERDVLTPYHPWEFIVPQNASALILESAKAGGLESVRAKFGVIGPNDDMVAYVVYDDKAIPTESVFVPVPGPGKYVVYIFEMTGGFLRLFADTGVPDRTVTALPLEVTETVVAGGPAPGTFTRDWARGSMLEGGPGKTEGAAGEAAAKASAFPLRVVPFVRGEGPTAGTQVRVTSAKGLVAEYTRFGRVDTALGSVGYTSEYWNTVFNPANLTRDLTVAFTNNSPTLTAGYVLVTYKRI